MIRCVCGIDERTCMREQQRAQSADPCDDRRDRQCYWCPSEATRSGTERDMDGNAQQRQVCDDCGESCDRAEVLHGRAIREEVSYGR